MKGDTKWWAARDSNPRPPACRVSRAFCHESQEVASSRQTNSLRHIESATNCRKKSTSPEFCYTFCYTVSTSASCLQERRTANRRLTYRQNQHPVKLCRSSGELLRAVQPRYQLKSKLVNLCRQRLIYRPKPTLARPGAQPKRAPTLRLDSLHQARADGNRFEID